MLLFDVVVVVVVILALLSPPPPYPPPSCRGNDEACGGPLRGPVGARVRE